MRAPISSTSSCGPVGRSASWSPAANRSVSPAISWPVRPLAIPAAGVATLAELVAASAAELFVDLLAVISVGIAAMVGDSVETRYGIKRLSRGWSSGSCSPSLAPLTGELITIANALTEHRRWWSSLLVTDGHHLSEGNGGVSDLGTAAGSGGGRLHLRCARSRQGATAQSGPRDRSVRCRWARVAASAYRRARARARGLPPPTPDQDRAGLSAAGVWPPRSRSPAK